jgi:hypothetical protein
VAFLLLWSKFKASQLLCGGLSGLKGLS